MLRSFADRLKQYVGADKSVTQAELARQAGLKPPSISDWMSGKVQADNVKAVPLLKAAAFLKLNPMWLLTGRGYPDVDHAGLHVAEPTAVYSNWPFDRVPPEVYSRLPEHIKTGLAQILEGAILGAQLPAEQRVVMQPFTGAAEPSFSDRISKGGQTGRDAAVRQLSNPREKP